MNTFREHAPMLRWFWRDDATESAVAREMARICAAGYGGLMLWPPHGGPGYLGNQWMHRIALLANECQNQSLQLWLGDDWAQPSGSGEIARAQFGEVPGEYASCLLRFEIQNLSREAAHLWTPPQTTPLAAWVVPSENKTPRWDEAFDLRYHWNRAAQKVASFNESVQIVLFFVERDTDDVDRLHPGTARFLLETTHETYRAHLEKFFGSAVRGFVTTGPPLGQTAPDALPWSPHLAEAFAAQHGYDLMARLPALIAPVGNDAVAVRQNFWQTVGAELERHWWRPLRDWCEKHHLQLALWPRLADESFNSAVQAYGDVTSALRGAHRLLVSAEESPFLARLSASVAALENQTPPLAIWEENAGATPPQARVNAQQLLWQHGVAGAICTSHEVLQPYAAIIEEFNAALAQRASLTAQTQPAGRVGVLLATRSAWAHYHPKGHRFTRWVWEDFQTVTKMLDELHFDFFVLPEAEFLSAPIHDSQLRCGRAQLPVELLVIPGVTALPWQAWRKIEAFVAQGGKVVCLGLLPRWSEKGRDEGLENHISQTTLLTVADLYAQNQPNLWGAEESSTGFPISRQNDAGGRLACYQPGSNPDHDDALLRVRQMLKDCLPAGLETQAPNLLFSRRENEHATLFYIANTGPAQWARLRLRAARQAPFELFEIDARGHALPRPVRVEFSADEGGGFSIEMPLTTGESRFLAARYTAATPLHIEKANFVIEQLTDEIVSGYATSSGTPRCILNRNEQLFTLTGKNTSLPVPLLLDDEWLCRRQHANMLHFDMSNHVTPHGISSTIFTVDSPPSTCEFQAPRGTQLWLNGESLTAENLSSVDEYSVAANTAFYKATLQIGDNQLEATSHNLALVGAFEISESGAIEAAHDFALSSGSWHEQGLPFYSGAVTYMQAVNMPREWQGCRVWLEIARVREGVAIEINGNPCGTALQAPFRFEITQALRFDAPNEIALTIFSALLPHATESGLLGPVRLVAYPSVEILIS